MERRPIEWNEGSICLIFRKEDRLECENYTAKTLLKTTFKIFSNILFNKLLPYVTKVIESYHCDFIRGKYITDQIQALDKSSKKLGNLILTPLIFLWILKLHMTA